MDRAQLLNDDEAAQRLILDGRQSTIWTALPGIITSVNFGNMTCEVQPAIQGTVEDEDGNLQSVNLPLLIHVPIVFPNGGGFIITFPLAAGDEVLIVWASRCVDAWWQNGGIQRPMEARMHDLSDGFAIPGPRSQLRKVEGISESKLQIRNVAGDAYFEIDEEDEDGAIRIKSPSVIRLEAPSVIVSGDLQVSGDAFIGGISFLAHEHPVTTAPGTTGAPIP